MTIKTPEDIESANKIIDGLKEEIKKIEKKINCAKNGLEHAKLEHDITEAVHKVFMNEGKDAHAKIDILSGGYYIVLQKYQYYGATEYIDIQTWEMQDGRNIRLSWEQINSIYGLKLLTHIVSSIIFKRVSILKKELKKLESQDTTKHESEEDDRHGDSETVG